LEEIPELSGDEELPPGQRYHLNSRGLRAVWIQRIAQSLELPTSASTAELRQMIDGKLSDQQEAAILFILIILGSQ